MRNGANRSSQSPQDDDLLKGLFEPVKHTSRDRKRFQPWHLPRKQYVRKLQWDRRVGDLLNKVKPLVEKTKQINYLGLAERDLLDLRVISDRCLRDGVSIRFLGFDSSAVPNSPARDALDETMHRLITEQRLDASSTVEHNRIEQIANPRSVAHRRLREYGPFDVVNIDLCDSIGTHSPGSEESYYNAILAILDMQQTRREPWLLFITTRADLQAVDKDALGTFWGKLLENVKHDQIFAKEFSEGIGVCRGELFSQLQDAHDVADDLFPKAYAAAFSKWLMHFSAAELHVPLKVRTKDAYAYSVRGNGSLDLFSISYLMTPAPKGLHDSSGLATNVSSGQSDSGGIDEQDLARAIAEVVVRPCDVEKELSEDSVAYEKSSSQTRDLLVEAGYSGEEFDRWLETGGAKEA
ncbi:hypothetical protein SR882_00390 [Guyparkeria halophila]|uniref:Uncharacterized protein n=1 Tax=Guyparkeria halophila TaxID=47960 RepID=A0ABZ0YWI2_9GAMM|nr:hypothetical protein [Guyparkeria halophila]WQH16388.1 hypothetical protein SR882_00390 [Guyparkeria halophila]